MKRLLPAVLSAILLTMLFSGCADVPSETKFDRSNQGNNMNIGNVIHVVIMTLFHIIINFLGLHKSQLFNICIYCY